MPTPKSLLYDISDAMEPPAVYKSKISAIPVNWFARYVDMFGGLKSRHAPPIRYSRANLYMRLVYDLPHANTTKP